MVGVYLEPISLKRGILLSQILVIVSFSLIMWNNVGTHSGVRRRENKTNSPTKNNDRVDLQLGISNTDIAKIPVLETEQDTQSKDNSDAKVLDINKIGPSYISRKYKYAIFFSKIWSVWTKLYFYRLLKER